MTEKQEMSNLKSFIDELEQLEVAGGKGKKARIIGHIRMFQIPVDKEELYEFMLLAASNICDDRYSEKISQTKKDISDAWQVKFEQAYQKAKQILKDDAFGEDVEKLYCEKKKEQRNARLKTKLKIVLSVVGAILFVAFVWGSISFGDRTKIKNETERLEQVLEQIYVYIEKGEYNLARSKAASLVFSSSAFFEDEELVEKWDITRNQLLEVIDEAEYGKEYVSPVREIRVGVSQVDLEGEDYQDVKKQLENRGFTNIKMKPTKDWSTGWLSDEGTVKKVSIDGETTFSEDSMFFSDVEIVIHYHKKETKDAEVKDDEIDGAYVEKNVKNFTFTLPRYWEEEGSKNSYLQYYAEKGDEVVMLSIKYPKETDENYDVSFEGLYADNENMIDAIGSMFTDGDVVDYEIFESDYGVKGILYQFTYNQKIDWLTKEEGSGYCFCFPSEDDRRWFYVTLLYTNNVDNDDYKDDYMKMISAIKEK